MTADRQRRPAHAGAPWVAGLGVAAALWVPAAALVAGLAWPGYSHRSQFISELGARGAPHGELFSMAGFLPAGMLLLAFAVEAGKRLARGPVAVLAFVGLGLYALGYVVAAFFRCDPGCALENPSPEQVVHTLVGGLGYPVGPASILALGVIARRWPGAGALSVIGIAGGIAGLVALPFLMPELPIAGVAQRVIEASVLGWVLACAIYLGRRPRPLPSAAAESG